MTDTPHRQRLIPVLNGLTAVVWTLIVSGSLYWNMQDAERQAMDRAYAEARANLNKDLTFRRWASEHGGVYVPITETQKSVPWLSHVAGRDVLTTDGQALTLLNPASMLKQIMDHYAKDYGIRGRITGLKYLNPDNAPDPWEKTQLEAFTHGEAREVWAVADLDGQPHLRHLRAMFMEPGCEKCHSILGYQLGDMRGATGINLPLAPYYQQIETARRNMGLSHFAIWFLGLLGIGWSSRALRRGEQQRQQKEVQRQQAETLVRASEERLRQMVEWSPEGINIHRDGKFIYLNPAALRMLGAGSAQDLLGKPILDIIHPECRQFVQERVKAVAEDGISAPMAEMKFLKLDGSVIDVEAQGKPIVFDGEPAVHVAWRDITESKQVKRQLEEQKEHLEELVAQRTVDLSEALEAAKLADETKDAFLANMSHELRTPLNAVVGMAGLARGLSTDPKQRDYLDKIAVSGTHLSRIINDLLDLSKIAAGYLEFETVTFSLRGVLERYRSVMAYRASEKGLELSEKIDESVPDVLLGDPLRLEQILLNLVGNAIKFTLTGRVEVRIALHASEEGRVCLAVEVEDSGVGIRPEDVERLFKPFSQADASVSRQFGGTGLGLAISKRLAEMMGGGIEVSSCQGKGSTFRVRLWLGLGKESDLPAFAECAQVFYRDARVLVVDDQPFNRDVAEGLLAVVGIETHLVENGQQALDLLSCNAEAFDLVLMDIQMPVMDGLTASRAIRRLEGFAELPIIAMTAHAMAHERERSIVAGMNDHIGKPFDAAGFYSIVAKWIPRDKQYLQPGATAPPALARGLPLMQGVDVDAGLALLSGDEARYRHWLRDFATTAPVAVAQMRRDLAAGALEAISVAAHALKGRLGLLGMNELFDVAAALEAATSRAESVDSLLHRLEEGAAAMCAEIHGKLGLSDNAEPAVEASSEKRPSGPPPASVTRLIASLQAGEGDCDLLIDACLAELDGTVWAPLLRQALAYVRNFDFAAAGKVLSDAG